MVKLINHPASPQNPDGYSPLAHLNPAQFPVTMADQGNMSTINEYKNTGNTDGEIEGPQGPWSI